MKYRIGIYMDDIYEVYNLEDGRQEFKGSLSDCEAWIRLTEKGYIF